MLLKVDEAGAGDGSVVRCVCCFCRGPDCFQSAPALAGSQLPVTQLSGIEYPGPWWAPAPMCTYPTYK